MREATIGGVQGIFLPLPDAPKQYILLGMLKVSAGFSSMGWIA
jgi:hypothetical protein